MMEMVWDDELAFLAQKWTENCYFEHECGACRKTERFSTVGQNLAIDWGNCEREDCAGETGPQVDTKWAVILQGFYDEIDLYDKQYLSKHKFDFPTGHFTQIIWSSTWKIGCGFVLHKRTETEINECGLPQYLYRRFYACDYAPTGGWSGKHVYHFGTPCSECPLNTCCGSTCYLGRKSYPGLCMIMHPQSPLVYPEKDLLFKCTWESNNDPNCEYRTTGSWKWQFAFTGMYLETIVPGGGEATFSLTRPVYGQSEMSCLKIQIQKMPSIGGNTDQSFLKLLVEDEQKRGMIMDVTDKITFFMPMQFLVPYGMPFTIAISKFVIVFRLNGHSSFRAVKKVGNECDVINSSISAENCYSEMSEIERRFSPPQQLSVQDLTSVEFLLPQCLSRQQPHSQDSVYIIFKSSEWTQQPHKRWYFPKDDDGPVSGVVYVENKIGYPQWPSNQSPPQQQPQSTSRVQYPQRPAPQSPLQQVYPQWPARQGPPQQLPPFQGPSQVGYPQRQLIQSYPPQQPPKTMSQIVRNPVPPNLAFCPTYLARYTLEHTACLKTPACTIVRRGLSKGDKQLILDGHNEKRSKVAMGQERRAGGLPTSSDMLEMVWDDHLAFLAQKWVENCYFEHECSPCKRTDRFTTVGQNLAIELARCVRDDCAGEKGTQVDTRWTAMLQGFYDEIDLFHRNSLVNHKFNPPTGHFTQMIWSRIWRVGCGFVLHKRTESEMAINGNRNWPYRRFYACDYFPTTGFIGQNVYHFGKPCSQCPLNTCCGSSCNLGRKSYPGLCMIMDPTNPLVYPKEPNVVFSCKWEPGNPNCVSDFTGNWMGKFGYGGRYMEVYVAGGGKATINLKRPLQSRSAASCFIVAVQKAPSVNGRKDQSTLVMNVMSYLQKPLSRYYKETVDLFQNFQFDIPFRNPFVFTAKFTVAPGAIDHILDIGEITLRDGHCQY